MNLPNTDDNGAGKNSRVKPPADPYGDSNETGQGKFGAVFVAPGRVSFRIWAPDCEKVDVVIGGATVEMERDDQGIFSVITDCSHGKKYLYRLDGQRLVPDPASRKQESDVHSPSVVVDQSYPWTNLDWRGRPWHETIIYELHPACFGGFTGIKSQLPRLAALGVTAIELMPISDFPGKFNWGYDGTLPYAPDTAYGTPEELKEMIDVAHGLRLQVFLDVVYNHFGPDGNYLSHYAGCFFRSDISTPWGDAIDFRRWQVRRFFIENALYWIDIFRFDGLRFDAVHAIKDDTFLLEMAGEIRARTAGRQVHLILENENNDASLLNAHLNDNKFNAQWTDDWHHCLHVLLTNEIEGYYADFQNASDQLARCLEEGFAFQGEPSLYAEGRPRGTKSQHLPPTAFIICLQNHDQVGNRALGERLTTLAKPATLTAARSLLLLTPQIPLIFMGEEWGETNPFLFFTDHHDELADAVRKGRRDEFSHFEAFANPATRELIPDPNNYLTFVKSAVESPISYNAEQQKVYDLYRHLLSLRMQHISPYLEGAKSLGAGSIGQKAVRGVWQLGDGSILTIAANFGDATILCLPGEGQLLFFSGEKIDKPDNLPPSTTIAWLKSI